MFNGVHKFTTFDYFSGLLIAKKKLFRNPVPSDCGGGSVFFVSVLGRQCYSDLYANIIFQYVQDI